MDLAMDDTVVFQLAKLLGQRVFTDVGNFAPRFVATQIGRDFIAICFATFSTESGRSRHEPAGKTGRIGRK
jgi:hypothetical protein